jgi:hypothetical protein
LRSWESIPAPLPFPYSRWRSAGEGAVVGRPAKARVYLGTNVTGAGEPTAFQDLTLFGGAVLTDGVFVG